MKETKPASIWRRVSGALIDSIIIAIITFVLTGILQLKNDSIGTLINVCISLVYLIGISYKFNGQTIGKFINKTRVVSLEGKLTLKQIIIRFICLQLLFSLPYIVLSNEQVTSRLVILIAIIMLIVMYKDTKTRGIHDLVAGTWVVQES